MCSDTTVLLQLMTIPVKLMVSREGNKHKVHTVLCVVHMVSGGISLMHRFFSFITVG